MKFRYTSKRYTLCALLFFLVGWGLVCAQVRCYRHTVQAGETLYRLSVKYGVSVDQIIAQNPSLKTSTLKAGEVVLIPAVSQETATEKDEQSGCRVMHKVKRKETLWGIAHQYGITVEELLKANPDIDGADGKLKKGSFLCIPHPAAEVKKVEKAVTEGYSSLKLAVVLPLISESIEAERSVEFYRGFLMAVNQMKKQGLNIQVTTYNEPSGNEGMADVLQRLKQVGPHLVVGPLYPTHFGEMEAYAVNHPDMKWVIPFSSKYGKLESCRNVFLLNAPDSYKVSFVANLFLKTFGKGSKAVFLHEADGNEKSFSALLRTSLSELGCKVADLQAGYTPQQMQAMLESGKQVIFVPEVSDSRGATEVMAKVKKLRESVPTGKFALLAYPEWATTAAVSHDDLYAADTYVFMNHFYNPYAGTTQRFADEYKAWFGTTFLDVYPKMALLGYDAGLQFMNGLKRYGKDFATQSVPAKFHQTDLHFSPTLKTGGYVNDCMYFIHYRPTRTIDKLTAN